MKYALEMDNYESQISQIKMMIIKQIYIHIIIVLHKENIHMIKKVI